jgi:hypothetical protein
VREPSPDYSLDEYERPNQAWVCGLASEGTPCPAGPTASGRCPALAECAPVRDGDRWQCNRSAVRGGTCEDGPTPDGVCGRVHCCTPVRSLRAVRARFVSGVTMLVGGLLVVMLSADWRDEAIRPGPLAVHHAQLLEHGGHNDDYESRCAACHPAATGNLAGWTASLVIGHGDRPTQSQLCMNCHEKTIDRTHALSPHNLSAGQLQALSDARGGVRRGNLLARAVGVDRTGHGEIACATCHREHQGPHVDLTEMDNAACQACHRQQYHSFAADHPDFGMWPYERRTRIVFDHVSHQAKHFAERKQTFDCRTCHVEDASSRGMLTLSYEQTCAACHDERIATSVARGLPMFALPTLDETAFRAAGLNFGVWPAEASGDFDGRLPPLMKLLLAADPSAARAMDTLGADFEFLDVDPDDREHLAASAALAVAIQQLFSDLNESATRTVRERLVAVLGRDLPTTQIDALLAGLSIDTVRRTMFEEWGRDSIAQDDSSPPDRSPSENDSRPLFSPAGTWFYDETTLSIRYRPAAHNDPVLTSLHTLLVEPSDAVERPIVAAMRSELNKPTAPGLCASCHSVESRPVGGSTINWRAANPSGQPRTFTKFSHGPHIILPQMADCSHCHTFDPAANTAASYAGLNPNMFVSEFLPLSKSQCVECHTPRAAGDNCQKCHNYHVEQVEPWRGQGD